MALAVLVALVQSPALALFAGGIGLAGHAIDAYLLGPRIYGRVTRLHALVAMAALLVGAELAGVLGALFAVPIAAVGNIFLGALYRARRGEEPMSTTAERGQRRQPAPARGRGRSGGGGGGDTPSRCPTAPSACCGEQTAALS